MPEASIFDQNIKEIGLVRCWVSEIGLKYGNILPILTASITFF